MAVLVSYNPVKSRIPPTVSVVSCLSAEPSCRPRDLLQPGLEHPDGAEGPGLLAAVRGAGSDGAGQLRAHAGPQLPPAGAAPGLRGPSHAAPARPAPRRHRPEPAQPAAAPAAAQAPGTAGTAPAAPADCQLAPNGPRLNRVPCFTVVLIPFLNQKHELQ